MAPTSLPVSAERKSHMTIESGLEQVLHVGAWVKGILKEVVSDDVAAYKIEVAVAEAVNNIIKHAYGLERGHEIEIEMSLSSERVIFTICDTGKAMRFPEVSRINYDPGDRPHLPEDGMGIPLMKSIMDDVSYSHREGKNCIVLCKRL
jgi:serine/threonine-protein kinase RsbW